MTSFHTQGLHGYSVKFSPFSPTRLACVACQQYGISGTAALLIFEFDPNFNAPIAVTQTCKWEDGLFDVSWSELDEAVCVTAGGDGGIQVWNITNNVPMLVLREHEKEVYSVDWCHTGDKNLVISGSWDNTVKLWDIGAGLGKSLGSFAGHYGVVYSAVWSPHISGCFASTSADGTARIWDIRKQYMPQHVIPAHETEVLSCDWSKYDDKILITGSVDCSLRVWDLRNTKSCLCQMCGHTYAVRRVRCSPYVAGTVASCSYDFTVRTWDFLKPQGLSPLLETIDHHTEFVYGVDFSTFVPGLVADCGWDETIRLYKPQSLNVLQTL
uniref:Peroxin-7 n=1 Tax=Phallusia mammillata TaxID=59560 RepID=A0A6F9DMW4_9ASCI|nr:peroxisomal targeting signal 2 receptor-like [Phallusia mammillata]